MLQVTGWRDSAIIWPMDATPPSLEYFRLKGLADLANVHGSTINRLLAQRALEPAGWLWERSGKTPLFTELQKHELTRLLGRAPLNSQPEILCKS
jgi:hypothetical protein